MKVLLHSGSLMILLSDAWKRSTFKEQGSLCREAEGQLQPRPLPALHARLLRPPRRRFHQRNPRPVPLCPWPRHCWRSTQFLVRSRLLRPHRQFHKWRPSALLLRRHLGRRFAVTEALFQRGCYQVLQSCG